MSRALAMTALVVVCLAITYLALFRGDQKDRP
jgi:hypothetical protein